LVAAIEVAGLTKQYRGRRGPVKALDGLDLEVPEGGVFGFLGANGAGKTTTLRAISGTVATSGDVVFAGKPLSRRPEAVARAGVAHVPEGRGTFAQLSVIENLRLGAYVRRDRDGVKADLDRVFGRFPILAERRGQAAGSLSGGEQQQLALARALMQRPRLLLLDEPSLGLAPLVVAELFRVVGELNEREGLSVLVVEQNASLALASSSRAYVLEVGRIAVAGASAELQRNESVRRSYLGY
jgi:branched-chain amino acid transport system ATP-binding protein